MALNPAEEHVLLLRRRVERLEAENEGLRIICEQAQLLLDDAINRLNGLPSAMCPPDREKLLQKLKEGSPVHHFSRTPQ